MRVVISDPASGKSYQVELGKDMEAQITGKKIGDELDGNLVGAAGYALKLTGGSDTSGFPMRSDVHGTAKKAILTTDGIGFHSSNKGERRRCMVRGNTYSAEIMQINAVVVKTGPVKLDQLFAKKEGKEKENAS